MLYMRLSVVAALLSSVVANFPFQSSHQHGMTRLLEEDVDYSWMNGYTVMYENCFAGESLAAFRLCPADSSCRADCQGAGEYLLDMLTFVDSFTEAQLGGREYRCEMARENCGYDDDALCYQEAGLEYCQENEDEFNLQEWLECKQFEDDNENENGANYYVGPYCASDNFNIHLGLFTDQYCTVAADVSFSETFGYVLDYSEEAGVSIIADDCAECREHHNDEDQDEDDAEDEDDVIEQCEEIYADSTKCESSQVNGADDSGCSYIKQLQKGEKVTIGAASGSDTHKTRKIVFSILGGALALLAFCSCYYFTMRKDKSGMKQDLM